MDEPEEIVQLKTTVQQLSEKVETMTGIDSL